jgi:hypothetical protein
MANIEVDRSRTTAQRTLGDRQGQAVHDADERDDPRGLAHAAHGLADGTQVLPIAPDAAALDSQPYVLVPQVYDAFQAVRALIVM